jgi:hypothetical protein
VNPHARSSIGVHPGALPGENHPHLAGEMSKAEVTSSRSHAGSGRMATLTLLLCDSHSLMRGSQRGKQSSSIMESIVDRSLFAAGWRVMYGVLESPRQWLFLGGIGASCLSFFTAHWPGVT